MKPFTFLFQAVLITALLFLISCSSKSDSSDIPSTGKITMKVDGNNWEATGANGMRMSIGGNQQLSIAGTYIVNLSTNTMDTVTLAFITSGDLQEGDYIHRNTLPYVQVTFNKGDSSPQNTYHTKEAQVTITRLRDNSIQGTFSAVLSRDGVPDITITDGGFNVNIM